MRLKLKKIRNIGFIVFAIIATLFAYKCGLSKISFGEDDTHQNNYFPIKSNYQQVNPIYIDDLDPNFSWNKTASENTWCSGSGTYLDPYIIEDIIINDSSSEYCIFITNSLVWFKIRNCSLTTSGNPGIGLKLTSVRNGVVSDNLVSDNRFGGGIRIEHCENLTIYRNIVNHNGLSHSGLSGELHSNYGIDLYSSNNLSIIDNNITNNQRYGIQISFDCTQNLISGNILKENGLWFYDLGSNLILPNNIIDNYLDEKPVYYYFNESDLNPLNFSNAGQIILVNCSNAEISSLNISNSGYFSSIGISLYFCIDILVFNNIFGHGLNYGIYIMNSSNLIISNNSISFSTHGILSKGVLNSSITKNIFRSNYGNGITLSNSNFNNLSHNIFEGNLESFSRIPYSLYGISLYLCHFNNITENEVKYYQDIGITFDESNYNIITNNTVYQNNQGIQIANSNNITVFNNYIDNLVGGINLIVSYDCSIMSNKFYDHELGIYVEGGNNHNLMLNNLTQSDYGIRLKDTDFNAVISNKIVESEIFGIYLELNCQDNIISCNLMEKCGLGIQERDIYSLSFLNEIDATNLVNDKQLYYFVDQSYLKPSNFTNAGQIILVKCNDSLISNVSISYSSIGISLFFCSNISISNSLISYNSKFYGLFLFNSHNTIISGNIIERNYIGIYLVESNFNRIVDNSFLYNPNPYEQIDCIGNTFNNNQIITFEGLINLIIIIIIISSLGATITISSIIIVKKRRKKKRVIPLDEIDKIVGKEEYELIVLKKKILNLGTVFDRLHISEIAEECESDLEKTTSVVKEMIENRELSAKFKLKTNHVIFKQQDIASEIDKLLEIYDKWENLKYSEKKL